jgi:hypothetical protein
MVTAAAARIRVRDAARRAAAAREQHEAARVLQAAFRGLQGRRAAARVRETARFLAAIDAQPSWAVERDLGALAQTQTKAGTGPGAGRASLSPVHPSPVHLSPPDLHPADDGLRILDLWAARRLAAATAPAVVAQPAVSFPSTASGVLVADQDQAGAALGRPAAAPLGSAGVEKPPEDNNNNHDEDDNEDDGDKTVTEDQPNAPLASDNNGSSENDNDDNGESVEDEVALQTPNNSVFPPSDKCV